MSSIIGTILKQMGICLIFTLLDDGSVLILFFREEEMLNAGYTFHLDSSPLVRSRGCRLMEKRQGYYGFPFAYRQN
jgi:hypothetical protein